MKSASFKILVFTLILFLISNSSVTAQNFNGKAIYVSKSKMELGNWGARLSEAQKKQVAARLKNRLEKKYILTFNKQEASFKEETKIDAISGATDSWGAYFSRGEQYKNIKTTQLIQSQEFYGKRFLVKDNLYKIDWTLGTETKQIGAYTCYKAKAFIPNIELNWYNFSWSDLRNEENTDSDKKENMVVVEAWYTSQIPLAHGPGEFWGLPGLILEVNVNNTTLLCTEVTISKGEAVQIEAPDRGTEITKEKYSKTIRKKMAEMRNNRMRRRG